ncbi:MAG: YceI family protein [Bacteroidia bacterium]|nr:MAG: YceI family protein [Bacteroidia bacterium]
MKKLAIILVTFLSFYNLSAQKYMTRNGYIGFFSHTPMEDIKADNNQVASVLDTGTGEIVFQVLMKSFKFEKSLMEEHFNENYVESEKFPKSTFSGEIGEPSSLDLTVNGKYEVVVEGDLTIHGITKKVSAPGIIEVKNESIVATAKFVIVPEDYGIEIPGVVREKIAKELEVSVEMKYTRM